MTKEVQNWLNAWALTGALAIILWVVVIANNLLGYEAGIAYPVAFVLTVISAFCFIMSDIRANW